MSTVVLFSGTPTLSSFLSGSSSSSRTKPATSPHFFFFNPCNVSSPDPPLTRLFSSRRITNPHGPVLSSKKWAFRRPISACVTSDQSELPSESQPNNKSLTEATIDLQLPRRRLLVQVTCNSCGERTERHVNRLAYERGTVFVQSAGCLQHHKLVDNLGLVVEYDLRKDENMELNSNHD